MSVISFKPKQVTKKLLVPLPDRARDVLEKRFGLTDEDKMTLEAIGQIYGITRERVRQIEDFALKSIRKSDVYEKEQKAFNELAKILSDLGGVIAKDELLSHITKDNQAQNHITLLLILGDGFVEKKEDSHFRHRWIVDHAIADKVHNSLKSLTKSLTPDDVIPEGDFLSRFQEQLLDVPEKYNKQDVLKRWLSISNTVGRNSLGDWGLLSSSNIKTRGIRDYAFLVIKKHGNPMHFSEVAREIEKTFNRKAHVATCHNELIKDPRFVLVGRGLYALVDWGYASGIVRDVIADILNQNGPLSKNEIVDKVLKERYVKPNTILVNIQNTKHFKKLSDGRYTVA